MVPEKRKFWYVYTECPNCHKNLNKIMGQNKNVVVGFVCLDGCHKLFKSVLEEI